MKPRIYKLGVFWCYRDGVRTIKSRCNWWQFMNQLMVWARHGFTHESFTIDTSLFIYSPEKCDF